MSDDAKYILKVFVLLGFGVWFLAVSLALYAFGFDGMQAGLDARHYRGHPIDYAMHWIVLFAPPAVAAIVCAHEFFKRR